MPEIKFLAKNIKKIRKEMKETQADFAANCGIGTGTLNALERQLSDPKLSSIQKIAAYVDKTVPELLSEEKTNENISAEERHNA
jgi:transcriptional regulator with XRE-family HTH domain